MQETAHESLESFMQDVKDGYVRGDAVQESITENVVVELSVADFQDGFIHLRVLVDDARIHERMDVERGMYYRLLYAIDDTYADIHEEVKDRIEAEVETEVGNAHEWAVRSMTDGADYPYLPEQLDGETTVGFEDHIQLRDDVTIIEAMETNRLPENTPEKYKKEE